MNSLLKESIMFIKFQIIIFTLLSCFLAQASQIELKRKLYRATVYSDIEEIRKLKEAGVDINAALDEHDFTALHLAVNMNNYELVKELRTLGADPRARADGGVVPFHMAQDLRIIRDFVLEDKIDPNIEDDSEATIAHHPYLEDVEALQFLKEAGLDLKKKAKGGFTTLHSASRKGPEFIDYLIANEVDVHAKITEGEFKGCTALHLQGGGAETESLLKGGADPNAKCNGGFTPLYGMSLDIDKTRFLLEYESDPNARNDDGDTPLHIAANSRFHSEIILEAGGDPNARNNKGETPLHTLSGYDDLEDAMVLINGGADPTLKDNKGKLPGIVQAYPHLLLLSKGKENRVGRETSCKYVDSSKYYTSYKASQIKAVQCGRRSICMAEVFCSVVIGSDSNRESVGRSFQAVCSSLSNGECPEAIDCVLDRSVMEKEEKENPAPSNTATPQSSSKGVR